jgi:hypothetical protein
MEHRTRRKRYGWQALWGAAALGILGGRGVQALAAHDGARPANEQSARLVISHLYNLSRLDHLPGLPEHVADAQGIYDW